MITSAFQLPNWTLDNIFAQDNRANKEKEKTRKGKRIGVCRSQSQIHVYQPTQFPILLDIGPKAGTG